MRTWNCRNIQKSPEAPGGVPEILFNLPAIVGFSKKGANVSERDIQVDEETVVIAQYPLILIKKYMSYHVIQKITNWEFCMTRAKVYNFT